MRQLKIGHQITSRESESLDKYLQEIGKVDLISTEEEVALAKRIREGDDMALEKLTKANLRFVVSVAKQYQHRGLPLMDLINEGNLGLIKAGRRFDETRGFKFISYAVWWIRQSIMQALAEQSRVVRLPLNRVGNISKISKAFSELEQRFQRDPTVQELAELLDTTTDMVSESLRISQKTLSADAPIGMDDQTNMLDTVADRNAIPPDSRLLDEALKMEILRVLSTLSPREMEVVVLYYGLNNHKALTLEEIGEKFSITRERVRQIKEHATRILRKSSVSRGLKIYLG